METMKDFLDLNSLTINGDELKQRSYGEYIEKDRLGLFFWEEVKLTDTFKVGIEILKVHPTFDVLNFCLNGEDSRITRYALDCLGEEKIKELIEGLK